MWAELRSGAAGTELIISSVPDNPVALGMAALALEHFVAEQLL